MPQSSKNLSRLSPWVGAIAGAALLWVTPQASGQSRDALTPPPGNNTPASAPAGSGNDAGAEEEESFVPEVEGSPLLSAPGAASSANNIGGMPVGEADFGIGGGPQPTNLSFGGARPDIYVVVRGDTMWDISGRFWGDPYFWPTLWSYNPSIGNAHFIYPGNILRFSLGSPVRPPGMSLDYDEPEAPAPQAEDVYDTATDEYVEVAVSNAMECRPPIPFVEEEAGEEIKSNVYAFLDDQERSPIGRIMRSPAEKEFLSDGDILFIEFSRLSEVECGDIYSVYREERSKVRPPGQMFGSVGSLSMLSGEVRIVDIGDDYATGIVDRTYAEIRRGDLLSELIPVRKQVNIRSATKEVDGQIVASTRSNDFSLSLRDVVFIDRGEADGLAPGDTFYITRSGDGLPQYRRRGDNLPASVIGKLVVIDLGETVSTAMIIESARALKVGDRISMQVF